MLQSLTNSDPPGPTVLAYTPNGKKLITAGSNNIVRVYTTGSDGEPTNLEDCQENNTAIAAAVRNSPCLAVDESDRPPESLLRHWLRRWHRLHVLVGDGHIREDAYAMHVTNS